MKVSYFTVLAILLGAAFAPAGANAQDRARWLGNYQEAIQEAKRTGKPIFLEFRCEP